MEHINGNLFWDFGIDKFAYKYSKPTEVIVAFKFQSLLNYLKIYSSLEAEIAVICQRNHTADVHILHNADATNIWPQNTLFMVSL